MHIELTDHLRCPRDHEESFVILLPDRMEGRRVMAGTLACPTCDWRCSWEDGIPDFGGGWMADGELPLPPDAVAPMLGLEGPGGWIVLAGRAGALAGEVARAMPGVGIVAINPPATVVPDEQVQVLRTGAWPMQAHCLRGAVSGGDAAAWLPAMLGSLLGGRQMIGEGDPPGEGRLLGSAAGLWVAAPR